MCVSIKQLDVKKKLTLKRKWVCGSARIKINNFEENINNIHWLSNTSNNNNNKNTLGPESYQRPHVILNI